MKNLLTRTGHFLKSNCFSKLGLKCAILGLLSGIAGSNAAVLDNNVDPANLGKGEWIYIVSNAIKNLSDSSAGPTVVSSVKDVPSMMSYFRTNLHLQWITVKAGTGSTNFPETNPQFTAALVDAAHAEGIKVFGYTRSYGTDLPGEIAIADQCFKAGADGFIFDAEDEWLDVPNNALAAWQLLGQFKTNWPTKFLGHSPYANIYYHFGNESAFPYKEFGYWCDCVMPQVYWTDWSQSSSATVRAYGSPVKGMQWMDSNYNKFHSWLGTLGTNTLPTYKHPLGAPWTAAMKPIAPIGQADVVGATNQTYKDMTNFVGFLKRDSSCASPTGYRGCSFYRVGLQDTNHILPGIADSTIGEPAISTQPAGCIANVGSSVVFQVVASGSGTLKYEWCKNGVALGANGGAMAAIASDATSATLSIPSVQVSDAGNYTVVISNYCGAVTSSIAALSISGSSAPVILTQPQSETVVAGDNDGLSVEVGGSMPLFYQWYFNGTPLTNGTLSVLTIGNIKPEQAGEYFVVVSNSFGTVTSSLATITVNYGVRVEVRGNGTVAVNPSTTSYAADSEILLTAMPNAGSSFLGWEGDASGTENPTALTMNGNKTVTAVFSDLAVIPETVIVESRTGGSNFGAYADSSFANSTLKSTATGCTAGVGSRYAWSTAASVSVTPQLANAGAMYLLETTHGSASSVSANIMVQATISGGHFINGTSPTTLWTAAFRQASPNVWKNIGKFVLDPGVTQPTFTFTTTNTDLSSTTARFVSDAYRFTAVLQGIPSSTTLTSSTPQSTYGEAVSFTATVTGAAGTPTGTVTFYDQETSIGTAAVNSNGVAVLAIYSLDAVHSPHSVTASYSGDATYLPSTSTMVSHSVNFVAPTISLQSSANPAPRGTAVTFTAKVNGTACIASGSVSFSDGVTPLATVALNSSGIAKFTTSSLTMEDSPHSIWVYYSGDGGYTGDYSSNLVQVVTLPASSITLSSSANPAVEGEPVILTASVAGAFGTPTGTVTFWEGSNNLGTSALNASGTAALVVTTLTAAGSPHPITATYSGSAEYEGSTSSTLFQAVFAPITGGSRITKIWDIRAGSRSYVTTNATERGIAIHSISNHVLVVSRTTTPSSIYVLDAETGAEVLQAGSPVKVKNTGVTGGTYDLNKIGVADDGVVYAANLTASTTSPFKIYRWTSYSATPTVAYTGTPGGTLTVRWGDSMAVRGSGTNTQIIVGGNTSGASTNVIIFTTTNGSTFTAFRVNPATASIAYDMAKGLCWGEGNTFYAKTKGNVAAKKFSFNLTSKTYALVSNVTPLESNIIAIGADTESDMLAGVVDDNTSNNANHRLVIYDASQPLAPTVLTNFNFPPVTGTASLANPNVCAHVEYGANKFIALDTQNGMVAVKLITDTKADAITTLVSSSGSAVYGQSITLTATVTGSGTTPTGSVIFYDETNSIGIATLDATGTAILNTSALLANTSPHTLKATYCGDADYNSSSSATISQRIDPATLTVVGIGAADKVYDGSSAAALDLDGAALVGVLNGDSVTLNLGAASGTFASKTVGENKVVTVNGISLGGTHAANYRVTPPATEASILPRTLVIGAVSADKVYDGTANIGVSFVDNRVAGDSLVIGCSWAKCADKNVGIGKSVNIVGISLSGVDAGNYSFNTTATTTANITARPITVTASAETKVYDGTTAAVAAPKITSGSLVAGDTATWTQVFENKNAGTSKTLIPSGTVSDGNGGANYQVALVSAATGVITPAPLTVTANDATREFGQPDPAFSVRYTGFIAGEDESVLNGTLTFNTGTTATSPLGTYPITPSGLMAQNYAISYVPGVFTIYGWPPSITTQPESQTGNAGTTVIFSVQAEGTSPLVYQWMHKGVKLVDGGKIEGATSSSLTVADISQAEAGAYSVVVTNGIGKATSAVAELTVIDPPVITVQPVSVVANLGKTAVFSVSATGTAPAYQWMFNGTPLSDGGKISGASTARLTIADVSDAEMGDYSVVLSNPAGTNASEVATLKVINIQVQITNPAADRFARTKLKVMGAASDIGGTLTQVLIKVNGGAYIPATACPGLDGLVDWYAAVQLDRGTNVISAKAVDISGCESDVATRSYFVTKSDFLSCAGVYNGLFYETNAVSHNSSGFFRINMTSAGTYSGRIWVAGVWQTITGKFDDNGESHVVQNGSAPLTIDLQLDIDTKSGLITGQVAGAGFVAALSGSKAMLEGSTASAYTVSLVGTADGLSAPGGDGYANLSIANDGLITLTGKLADGTVIAAKTAYVAQNGDLPLYVPLYGNLGSLLGWLTKSTDGTYSGNISWIKTGAYGTNYNAGFTNEVQAVSSSFSANTRPLNLTNAVIILGQADGSWAITNQVVVTEAGVIDVAPNQSGDVTLTLNASTGQLSGSFTDPVTGLTDSIEGIVLQNRNEARGFVTTPQAGYFLLRQE